MHVAHHALWKAEQPQKGEYQFHQFLMKQEGLCPDDYMTMSVGDGPLIAPRSECPKLIQDSKAWQFFFFKACGTEAFEDNKTDYDINTYDICYYRSSPFYEFMPSSFPYGPRLIRSFSEIREGLTNRDETFVFKTMNKEELEKVYILNLDHESEKTKLWYYTTTPEQREKQEAFEPKFFEKNDLPLLRSPLDLRLENRDKLVAKLDTWILMS
jgi:hypothetical protein